MTFRLTNSEVKHKNGANLKSYVPERDPTETFFFSTYFLDLLSPLYAFGYGFGLATRINVFYSFDRITVR